MPERCKKILQNSIARFWEFHLSLVQFELSYCGVHLPEAELMLGYESTIFSSWEELFKNYRYKRVRGLFVSRMLAC
jgi:hypothetical protein